MQRVIASRRLAACMIGLAAMSLAFVPDLMTAAEPARDREATNTSSVEHLVADALRAEVDGNLAKRRVLLSVAVDAAPEFAPARWHSGQVFTSGEWLPVKDAQAAAAADPARAEYQSLRAAAEGSPEAQLSLARWCRKHGLAEEARFHWTTLLTWQPHNDEALRALGLRWFNGRLMTKAEVAEAKVQMREWRERAEGYAPQLAKWERLLDAGDIKSRDEALAEIRGLRDAHAIPAIEELTLDGRLRSNDKFERNQQISEAFLAALETMPDQAATASLLRHAIFSPFKSVRATAIESLRKRPLHDFVPELLSALAMPIESSFRVVTDSDGSVHYFHSLYREGPASDWSFEGRLSAMQHDLQGPTFITIDDRIRGKVTRMRFGAANNPAVGAEMASVAAANQRQFGTKALAAERQIEVANRATLATNAVLIPVLVATTGEDFGDSPRAWWDWWRRYNEYSSDDEKPVQEQRYADATHRYYRPPDQYQYRINPPPPPPARYGRSCFAKGTQVWTKTGLVAIETLEIGDLVLAQNVDTGELAYKPVIGRTVRPPSAILSLRFGKESLETTLGHPLWVVGAGWRMAKEVGAGELLHGVNGPLRIDGIDMRDDAEAYNLVVDDFNSYFVGESGVLVHDNTLRAPTTALVPGLLAASAR